MTTNILLLFKMERNGNGLSVLFYSPANITIKLFSTWFVAISKRKRFNEKGHKWIQILYFVFISIFIGGDLAVAQWQWLQSRMKTGIKLRLCTPTTKNSKHWVSEWKHRERKPGKKEKYQPIGNSILIITLSSGCGSIHCVHSTTTIRIFSHKIQTNEKLNFLFRYVGLSFHQNSNAAYNLTRLKKRFRYAHTHRM